MTEITNIKEHIFLVAIPSWHANVKITTHIEVKFKYILYVLYVRFNRNISQCELKLGTDKKACTGYSTT